ncbi:YlbF family regulator [Hutsoniella sourekii]
MANNIYDTANQLERDLRELEAFQNLQKAHRAILDNQEANELFNEFRQQTQTYQEKQMRGEELSEQDISQIQELSMKVTQNELIRQLMQSEELVSQTINDINKIITRPLVELYENDPQ